MKDNAAARVHELRSQAQELPAGPARLAVLEEAVAAADASGQERLAFSTRLQVIEDGIFGGVPERAMNAFVWCLARCDAQPDTYHHWEVLWQYKWIIGKLPHFAGVSAEQIEFSLQDLERRYEAHHMGARAAHQLRMDCAMQMGRRREAEAAFKKWRATRRGFGSDCQACEQDRVVQFHVFRRQYGRAFTAAAPILEGKLRCAEIPHVTLGFLLVPYLERGRLDDAAEAHRRGYRLIRRGGDFTQATGQHLEYLALAGEIRAGISLLERHLAPILNTFNEMDRFDFLLPAALCLELLVREGRRRKLRLPPEFPLRRPDGDYDPAELRDWALAEVRQLAAALDHRNTNSWYADQIAERLGRLKRFQAGSEAVSGPPGRPRRRRGKTNP